MNIAVSQMQVVVSQELQQYVQLYANIMEQPVPDVIENALRHWMANVGAKDLQKAVAAAKR